MNFISEQEQQTEPASVMTLISKYPEFQAIFIPKVCNCRVSVLSFLVSPSWFGLCLHHLRGEAVGHIWSGYITPSEPSHATPLEFQGELSGEKFPW